MGGFMKRSQYKFYYKLITFFLPAQHHSGYFGRIVFVRALSENGYFQRFGGKIRHTPADPAKHRAYLENR